MDREKHPLDYLDLCSKILLPIALLGATLLFNGAADARHSDELKQQHLQDAQRSCIDLQIRLVSLDCHGERCSQSHDDTVVTIGESLQRTCGAAGIPSPWTVVRTLRNTSQTSHDVETSSAALQAAGQALPSVQPAGRDDKVSAKVARGEGVSPGEAAVYIEIQDESQRPVAVELQRRLNATTFRGQPLHAPPIERTSGPRAMQLRCMTANDCRSAPQLAAYISTLLSGAPVAVRDMSADYGERQTSAGRYEFWFGHDSQKASPSITALAGPRAQETGAQPGPSLRAK